MTKSAIRELSGERTEATVDWGVIHRRLDAVRETLVKSVKRSPEEKLALLKSRSKVLAQVPVGNENQREFIKVVQFRLSSETYGIQTDFVREIHPLKYLTPLPGVPSFVLGLVNVRGRIISVVDLKKFFHLPELGLGELNKVIILSDDLMEFGILADEVLGVHLVELSVLQALPSDVAGIGSDYVKGVTRERLIVLDAGSILRDPELVVNQGAE